MLQLQFQILVYLLIPSIYLIVNYFLKQVPVEDEALHMDQARAYYNWDFMSWNPMITTPPGLYIVSFMLCASSLAALRFTNFMLGMLLPHVVDRNVPLILLMPILFPFIFLFYTDCGSLFFVLLAELLNRHENFPLSALVGFVSLTFRQTNIIWIGRLAALSFIDYWNSEITLFDLYHAVRWYIPVACSFVGFIKWNRGIVLGDRKSHQPCLNIPQFFYCMLTLFLLVLPSHIVSENRIRLLPLPALLGLIFLHCMALKHFTCDHHYHGPQSRHIISYLLRYGFTGLKRYAWIPAYIYAEHIIVSYMYRAVGFLGTVLFLLCTAVTIVPSRLVEPRYHIIPAAILLKSLVLTEEQYYASVIAYTVTDAVLLGFLIAPVLFGLKPIIW